MKYQVVDEFGSTLFQTDSNSEAVTVAQEMTLEMKMITVIRNVESDEVFAVYFPVKEAA